MSLCEIRQCVAKTKGIFARLCFYYALCRVARCRCFISIPFYTSALQPICHESPVFWLCFSNVTDLPLFRRVRLENWKANFGKKVFQLQVVTRDGQAPSFLHSLLRINLKFLPWELSHVLVYQLVALSDDRMPYSLIALTIVVYG